MLSKFFFKNWPLAKQVSSVKKNGILIGTRMKDKRSICIYMYRDLFVEVIYHNDDPEQTPESANVVKGLKNLNDYLENEFKESNF